MTSHHISKTDRAEMLRSANGLVTAVLADDHAAVAAQTRAILIDHIEAAAGDREILLARLGKQLEAGAHVTQTAVRMLARRAGLSPEETQRALAEAAQSELPLPD